MKLLIPFIFLFFLFFPLVSAEVGDLWIIDYQKGNAYLLGMSGNILEENGHLTFPDLIKAAPDGGAWVLDKGAAQVVKLDQHAVITSSFAIAAGTTDLAPYQAGVLITDSSRGLVTLYDHNGTEQQEWRRFRIPTLVERDEISGFWVGDADAVTKINGVGEKQFTLPFADVDVIAPTKDGGAWIADEKTRTVTKVRFDGEVEVTVSRYRRVSDIAPLPDNGAFLIDKDSRKVVIIDSLGEEVLALPGRDMDTPKYVSYDSLSQSAWITASNGVFRSDLSGNTLTTVDWIPHPGDLAVVRTVQKQVITPVKEPLPSWRKEPSPVEEKKEVEKQEEQEETIPSEETEEKDVVPEQSVEEKQEVTKPTQDWTMWIGIGSLGALLLIFIIILVVQKTWKRK